MAATKKQSAIGTEKIKKTGTVYCSGLLFSLQL
jgi:hypothetical protein